MTRTKWMRLVVREPADVLRWASEENARRLDEFRYRVIGGREYVSFRLVPRYPIDIGTREIIVVACARGRAAQRLARASGSVRRRVASGFAAAFAWLVAPRAGAAMWVPAQTAELHRLPNRRRGSPSRL
jgi:hypothetical protein